MRKSADDAAGRRDWFRRGTGALTLLVAPDVYAWGHGGPGPCHVPTWWVGGVPLDLPLPPFWLDALVWVACGVAGLALIVGRRGRLAPAVALGVLGYFACRDRWAAWPSYHAVLLVYLASLLFPGRAGCVPVRAVVSICYLASAVHKGLRPEWVAGETLLDMARHGVHVRPVWVGLLGWVGPEVARAAAWGVVAGEAAIGAGLWSRRWRHYALGAGVLLHVSIQLFISDVEMFAPTMLVGYLAYGREGGCQEEGRPVVSRGSLAVGWGFALLIAVTPFRHYAFPASRGWAETFSDSPVWSFSMFLLMDEVEGAQASYRGADGVWKPYRVVGRGVGSGSREELGALARHVLGTTPGATAARVGCRVVVNHARTFARELMVERGTSERGGQTTAAR